jgi:hypothetical protein
MLEFVGTIPLPHSHRAVNGAAQICVNGCPRRFAVIHQSPITIHIPEQKNPRAISRIDASPHRIHIPAPF